MSPPSLVPGAAPTPAVPRAAWGLLGMLTLLNVLNFVDRLLIGALAPLLIAELGLTRAQIGLLAGFSFVVLYSVMGLVLGVVADRWRRLPLVAAGVALWSAMTALSGLARSFGQLALPRLFVGIGEATLGPAALAMIADAFPERRRGFANGVYYAAIPLGSGLGLIASGWIAPRWGWRACFLVLGAVGIVAALAVLAVREPARPAPRADGAPRPPLGPVLRAVLGQPTLLLALAAGILLAFGAAAASVHALTWLVEERGFPFARAALLAGLMAVAGGFVGNVAGGAFGDRCARRRPHGHLWSLVPMTAFFAPVGLALYALPARTPLFYLCWFLTVAGGTAWFGPLFAAVQELAPPAHRATTVALAIVALNVAGAGAGPLVTGILGDRYGLTIGLATSVAVAAAAVVPAALAARRAPPRPAAPG